MGLFEQNMCYVDIKLILMGWIYLDKTVPYDIELILMGWICLDKTVLYKRTLN